MSSPWMQTVDLCRYYQRGTHEVRAVDRVTVGFERGEFTAVVGASGSGKSTLLNLLAGLDTPTSGHIAVSGVRLSSLSRRELAASQHVCQTKMLTGFPLADLGNLLLGAGWLAKALLL